MPRPRMLANLMITDPFTEPSEKKSLVRIILKTDQHMAETSKLTFNLNPSLHACIDSPPVHSAALEIKEIGPRRSTQVV